MLLSISNPPLSYSPLGQPIPSHRQTNGIAGAELTLAGCLPLPVLGVCLIQVGEAGSKLQDAVQRRKVELTCGKKDFHLNLGIEPIHPPGSRQSVTQGPRLH